MGSLVLATLTPLLADYKWQVAAEILVQITPPSTVGLAGSGLALASTIVFARAAPVAVLWPIAFAPLALPAFQNLYRVSPAVFVGYECNDRFWAGGDHPRPCMLCT